MEEGCPLSPCPGLGCYTTAKWCRHDQEYPERLLNWLDLTVLALVGVPALLGFRAGLIRGAATLAGIIVGIILASQFQGLAARLLGLVIEDETMARAAGFVLILFASILAAWLLAALLQRVLSLLLLGWLDRVGGALLGLLMGALIASVVLLVMDLLPIPGARAAVEGSAFAPLFQRLLLPLVKGLPGEIGSIAT